MLVRINPCGRPLETKEHIVSSFPQLLCVPHCRHPGIPLLSTLNPPMATLDHSCLSLLCRDREKHAVFTQETNLNFQLWVFSMLPSMGKNTKVSFQKLSSRYSWKAVLYKLNTVNTLTGLEVYKVVTFIREDHQSACHGQERIKWHIMACARRQRIY